MPIVRKIAPPERDEPEGPPPGFPPLTRDHIRAWLGEATLRRGEPYVEDCIFDTRRTGRTLKARCQGSASQPYRVEATIGARGGVALHICLLHINPLMTSPAVAADCPPQPPRSYR